VPLADEAVASRYAKSRACRLPRRELRIGIGRVDEPADGREHGFGEALVQEMTRSFGQLTGPLAITRRAQDSMADIFLEILRKREGLSPWASR